MSGKILKLRDVRETAPPDNAIAEHVTKLKRVMLQAITLDDVRDMMLAQVTKAKKGDGAAVKLLLGMIGDAAPSVPRKGRVADLPDGEDAE